MTSVACIDGCDCLQADVTDQQRFRAKDIRLVGQMHARYCTTTTADHTRIIQPYNQAPLHFVELLRQHCSGRERLLGQVEHATRCCCCGTGPAWKRAGISAARTAAE